MIKCNRKCLDIENNPDKGILPRCLILEKRNNNPITAVVVGINPGRLTKEKADKNKHCAAEMEFYKKNKKYTDKFCKANRGLIKNKVHYEEYMYFKRMRNFIDELGYKGSILWTELVKCQSKQKGFPRPETIRMCTKNYLDKELDCLFKDKKMKKIPLFALGDKVYEILSPKYTHRLVIGVPHPTGRSPFIELFNKSNKPVAKRKLKKKFKKIIEKNMKDEHKQWNAIKLLDYIYN